jgi:hypothetical protein
MQADIPARLGYGGRGYDCRASCQCGRSGTDIKSSCGTVDIGQAQESAQNRGIARLFVSDVEDLPWFHDRDFWREYLTHLVAQRFNRVHLAFGIGHDFLRNVLDAYLLFASSIPG